MSVLGTRVTVIAAKDETKVGRKGDVVLETEKTLLLQTLSGTITVEKAGTVLQVEESDEPLSGDDIRGKLEDRIRERRE
jgi:RNase P/RNase MRP subunit p29